MEGVGPDLGHAGGNFDGGERRAVPEGGVADGGDGVRQTDGGQRRASVEHRIRHGGGRSAERHRREVVAPREGARVELPDGGRDGDFRQPVAILEDIRRQLRDALRDADLRKGRAPLEGLSADRDNRPGDREAERCAAAESLIADRGQLPLQRDWP